MKNLEFLNYIVIALSKSTHSSAWLRNSSGEVELFHCESLYCTAGYSSPKKKQKI